MTSKIWEKVESELKNFPKSEHKEILKEIVSNLFNQEPLCQNCGKSEGEHYNDLSCFMFGNEKFKPQTQKPKGAITSQSFKGISKDPNAPVNMFENQKGCDFCNYNGIYSYFDEDGYKQTIPCPECQSQGERASSIGHASESMSNKRDISNPDTQIPQTDSKESVLSTNEEKTELEQSSKKTPCKQSGSGFCLSRERMFTKKDGLFKKLRVHALDKHKVFPEEKVKEFIRRLKEELNNHRCLHQKCKWYQEDLIDKLAGEDLL